jgi:hypothetical protein
MLAGVLGVGSDFLKGVRLEQPQQPFAGAQQALGVPFLKFVLAAASHNLGATFPQDFELFLGEHEPYLVMVVSVGKLTVKHFPPARARDNAGLNYRVIRDVRLYG